MYQPSDSDKEDDNQKEQEVENQEDEKHIEEQEVEYQEDDSKDNEPEFVGKNHNKEQQVEKGKDDVDKDDIVELNDVNKQNLEQNCCPELKNEINTLKKQIVEKQFSLKKL